METLDSNKKGIRRFLYVCKAQTLSKICVMMRILFKKVHMLQKLFYCYKAGINLGQDNFIYLTSHVYMT